MRKNIEKVMNAFLVGKKALGKTCRTDGQNVWSYNMVIAKRLSNGSIVVIDEESSPSKTTTTHIRALMTIPRARIGKDFDAMS